MIGIVETFGHCAHKALGNKTSASMPKNSIVVWCKKYSLCTTVLHSNVLMCDKYRIDETERKTIKVASHSGTNHRISRRILWRIALRPVSCNKFRSNGMTPMPSKSKLYDIFSCVLLDN